MAKNLKDVIHTTHKKGEVLKFIEWFLPAPINSKYVLEDYGIYKLTPPAKFEKYLKDRHTTQLDLIVVMVEPNYVFDGHVDIIEIKVWSFHND